jgi:uncharacterized protein (DUF2147 family)
MKKLTILAALLMASTSAYAGNSVSFEIQGHKVHIEAPNNCDSLSCLQISAPGLSGSNFDFKDLKSTFNHRDDDDVATPADPPAQKIAPAPAAQVAVPQSPSAAGTGLQQPSSEVAATAPTVPAEADVAPAALPAPSVVAPKPAPVAAASAPASNTPLGVWATEENKGTVRIEQCGQNLCGFATKTGEKILINMKPVDAKWTGQIHDPDSGRNYDSIIAMKGSNLLRVQGCAFGGMFCGGQTWSRVS